MHEEYIRSIRQQEKEKQEIMKYEHQKRLHDKLEKHNQSLHEIRVKKAEEMMFQQLNITESVEKAKVRRELKYG